MASDGKTIIPTPPWVVVARAFQLILSLIVIGGSGWFIHGYYISSLGFAIVCTLFTWIIFAYAILSEKVSTCHRAYNTWAILALDGVMIVFWLAAMGAVADSRSKFTVDVTPDCTDDGSAINAGHCTITKRAGVATYAALDVMSAVAGVCALIMLLFVVTFAYVCHKFRLSWSSDPTDAEKQSGSVAANNLTIGPGPQYYQQQQQPSVELHSNMPQAQPLLNQDHYQHQQQQQQQSGWTEASYAQQSGAQPAPQYDHSQAYDPYVQKYDAAYHGTAGGAPYSPGQVGQQQGQVPYSPQGTPAPVEGYGQPRYQAP